MENRLFVVAPFYNEEKYIRQTLDRLAAQTDLDYTLVLVDNNSDDNSLSIIENWRQRHAQPETIVLSEPQKGTGAASDTGFRYAIEHGAKVIARTDADCLPNFDWVRRIKKAFSDNQVELLAGRILPRSDDVRLRWFEPGLITFLLGFAELYCRATRRDPRYKCPYILLAGNNMAIRAQTYLRSGGFPRTSFETEVEDRILSERVRLLTGKVVKRDDIVVYNSVRRLRKYGYLKTLLWYDRRYTPQVVDVR